MRLLFWLFLTLQIISCQTPEQKEKAQITTFSGIAMTIPYRVLIGVKLDSQENEKVRKGIQEVFDTINNIFNNWNTNSEISLINTAKDHTKIPLSKEMSAFLIELDDYVKLTGGRFDPTIAPIQKLWKTSLEKGMPPTNNDLADLIPAIGWDKIHFDGSYIWKEDSRTQLDLGGVAKGLAVDQLVDKLNGYGFPDVYVEWGGEIKVSGTHPEKRAWTVFISRLGDTRPENAIETIMLEDSAMATSGDYLQNWSFTISDDQGNRSTKTYCHVIDPKSGNALPVTHHSIASASVLAPSCTMADALATASMIFPSIEEAKAWSEELAHKHPKLQFWLVTRSINSTAASNIKRALLHK